MLGPKLEIIYAPGINEFLRQFGTRLEQSIPALLEAIGKRIVYRFKKNISNSQDASFVKFPPLSRPRRRGHNPAMRPLYDTGALFERLGFRVSGSEYVEAGDPTSYGVFQNRGTGHIPARPFITIDVSNTSNDIPSALLWNFAAFQFDDQNNGHGDFFAGVPLI